MKGGRSIIHKARRQILLICFIIYAITVLWYTVLKRQTGFQTAQFELFWSYKEWLSGDWNLGWQILANIALFIPLGILLPNRKRYLIIPILLSISIELLQLFTLRGLFEFDDILDNSLGAVIGWTIGRKIRDKWKPWIGVVSIVALSIMILATPTSIPNIPRMFCFQVDPDGGGFCFRIDAQDTYTIKVIDADGKMRDVKAETGIERLDVAGYFGTEYRYSGFQMEIPEAESEVLISYNPLLTIPTGVYVSGNGVYYANDSTPPSIVAPFVEDGILRVYRPDYHCWVYQHEGSLYWVVDKDFYFEDDGSTYIQYQLWTTQTDKLPQHRLDNNWLWDNIGGNFEDYELEGDWNGYRVMKRELPTSYPITSIVTGYHKDGKWIWKEYFRPYYEF